MPETTSTTNLATTPEEFYKYAYTSLLRRHVASSCDNVITCGEEFVRGVESLLNDMQEMIYNCTPDEVDAMKSELGAPQQAVADCVCSVIEALNELRRYKLAYLTLPR